MNNVQLIQGDSIEFMSHLPSGSVDAIITDPPYGILKHAIETGVDIPLFMSESHRVLKPLGFMAFFGKQPTLTEWNRVAMSLFHFNHEVIWYKRQRSSPMGDMGRVHENISIFCKGKRQLNAPRLPYMDFKQSLADISGSEGVKRLIGHLTAPYKNRFHYERALRFLDRLKSGADMSEFYDDKSTARNEFVTIGHLKKRKPSSLSAIEVAVNGILPQSVVSFVPHNKSKFDSTGQGRGEFNLKHPTVKPIPLMEWLIELVSNTGDLVLDPFMGTGTTGLAAKQTGRDFIGVEIDPKYYQIAQERIAGTSGKKETCQLELNLI